MKKVAIAFASLLVVGMFALGACGTSGSGGSGGSANSTSSNTVTLGATNFDQHKITIKAGTPLTFDNTNGAFHQLCLGTDMHCNMSATGPKDLEGSGFQISPGQKHTVTFDTPGTYDITCTIHVSMNLTVTVQ